MNFDLTKIMDAPDDSVALLAAFEDQITSIKNPSLRILYVRKLLRIANVFKRIITPLECHEEATLRELTRESILNYRVKELSYEDVWLTVKELCELLECGESTIYGWINKRLVPYYKVESGVRFLKSEIMEWIRNKRVRTTTEIRQRASTQN